MEDNDRGRCMHGCYPTDIDIIRKIARSDDLSDYSEVSADKGGPEVAEKYLDKNQPNGEPYVGAEGDDKHQRFLVISASSQGAPLSIYMKFSSLIGEEGYDKHKVKENFKASTGSQLEQEMNQRHQQAQQQVNRSLGGLEDLYKKKQLLEHDLRKLEQKKEHYGVNPDDYDSKKELKKALKRLGKTDEELEDKSKDELEEIAEESQKEEALKADFVDEVDQHTGRNSILQMQANNIFPSITADFYSMKSLKDLTDGHLSELPEQEKAMLRKKWKLYQKWKEKFEGGLNSKLDTIRKRLNSVETSIQQTKEFLRPYVETIRVMQGDFDEKMDLIDENELYQGYSSAIRTIKMIAEKVVNTDSSGSPAHRDVIVANVTHINLAGPDQPQSPSRGPSKIKIKFKSYLVCEHIFQEVFQPQIDARRNDVERYIKGLIGEDLEDSEKTHLEKHDVVKHSDYEEYSWSLDEKLKRKFYEALGIGGDDYYVEDPTKLREEQLGPDWPTPFWINYKISTGMFLMK